MTIAIYSRVLQFRAGPNEHRFYACEQHRSEFVHVELFFPTDDEPIRDEHPDDEYPCDFCREGGQ